MARYKVSYAYYAAVAKSVLNYSINKSFFLCNWSFSYITHKAHIKLSYVMGIIYLTPCEYVISLIFHILVLFYNFFLINTFKMSLKRYWWWNITKFEHQPSLAYYTMKMRNITSVYRWMAVFYLFQIPYNLIANDEYLKLQWFSENNCFKHNDSDSHGTMQRTEVKRLLHTQFVVLSQKKRKTVETITLRVSQDSVVAT